MSRVMAIRVKNLRSLEDTGFVEIKPVTVLVGRNSAGKSTFARILPLLRQSIEVNKRSPILWFGRYVDFGAFHDALRSGATDPYIEFTFKTELTDLGRSKMRFGIPDNRALLADPRALEIELMVRVVADNESEGTAISEIQIKLFDHTCTLYFGLGGKTIQRIVSGNFTWTPSADNEQMVSFRSFLPKIDFFQQRTIKVRDEVRQVMYPHNPLQRSLHTAISQQVHGNAKSNTLEHIASHILIGTDEVILESMKRLTAAPATWQNSVRNLTKGSHTYRSIKDRLFADTAIGLLPAIDDTLASSFSNVQYLEPLRATAQRYYRRQELATDEIDSKGANIAFYLDSLRTWDRDAFDTWMQEHFRLTVKSVKESGHISLLLRDTPSGNDRNIADIGFGFSQVLPIAVQLWASTRQSFLQSRRLMRERIKAPVCLVLEQPELHLHPEYQAKLADVVAACIQTTTQQGNLSVVAETHSPSFVNRLGALVAEGKLMATDVQVLLFEKNEKTGCTAVRRADFDQNGVLQNWPYGFFEPVSQ